MPRSARPTSDLVADCERSDRLRLPTDRVLCRSGAVRAAPLSCVSASREAPRRREAIAFRKQDRCDDRFGAWVETISITRSVPVLETILIAVLHYNRFPDHEGRSDSLVDQTWRSKKPCSEAEPPKISGSIRATSTTRTCLGPVIASISARWSTLNSRQRGWRISPGPLPLIVGSLESTKGSHSVLSSEHLSAYRLSAGIGF